MKMKIKINECPRDAIQGLSNFIPTQKKIDYYQHLLQLGFDRLDFGSFVSPHAVPQMKDTIDVVDGLDLNTKTELLVIVGNSYGATQAAAVKKISYIGYPFSISESFMKKNTNASISKGLRTIVKILDIAKRAEKEVVVFLSMAFGNPYKDDWSLQLLEEYVEILSRLGVKNIQLSDTTAEATAADIHTAFSTFIPKYKKIEFGLHLHVNDNPNEKIKAATNGGCRSFDTTIGGMGGCPLTGYEMVANLKTCDLRDFCLEENIENSILAIGPAQDLSRIFYNESL